MVRKERQSELEEVMVADSTEIDPTAGVDPQLPTRASAAAVPSTPRDSSSPSDATYTPQTLQSYENTLIEWKKKSSKMAFIYDYVGDKYRKKLNRASITSFTITSCISLLALGNLGLQDADYPTISLVLKGVNAGLAVSAAIATGLPRILGWGLAAESCQKYQDTVENFIASIMSEMALPVKFRTDPAQYILEHKEKYQAILDSAPHVSHDDYTQALDAYEQQKGRLRYEIMNR